MASDRVLGWIFGVVSVAALLLNWAAMVYFSTPSAYRSDHLWGPIAEHGMLKFGVIMVLGTISGIVASVKHSWSWLVFSALNVISYLLEVVVS